MVEKHLVPEVHHEFVPPLDVPLHDLAIHDPFPSPRHLYPEHESLLASEHVPFIDPEVMRHDPYEMAIPDLYSAHHDPMMVPFVPPPLYHAPLPHEEHEVPLPDFHEPIPMTP